MFTPEDIDVIVNRAFDGESVEIIDCQQNAFAEEKFGFLGDHQTIEITVKRDNGSDKETHRFFVKAVPHGSEEQSKFIRERKIFHQEALFFNSLFPLLTEHYVGEEWCPKCLLAKNDVIVLADMRCKGFAMHDTRIFQGDHLKSAVRAQARMHACSILAEARLGKSLKDVCPEACKEQLFNKAVLDTQRVQLYSDLAEKVAKKAGRDDRRLRPGFFKAFMHMYQSKSQGKFVTGHGDTWPNNYLFDSSKPPKCVLVDFQLVRYAPRMYDVAQLVYLSTTCEIRRNEERRVIEAYHEELCHTLKRNNPSLERPSLEDILKEYEDVRMCAMYAAVMYYPIIRLNKSDLAKYGDPDELYKKIMFRKENDFVLQIVEESEEFYGKLRELVEEIIDYYEKIGIPTELENGILP